MATTASVCSTLLKRFSSKDDFLLRLVTVDETWVHYYQGSYRREKTKFPDISLTQIQISLTKTIGDRQNIFSPKLLFTMRQQL